MDNPIVISPTVIGMLAVPFALCVGAVILWKKLKSTFLLVMFFGFLVSFISTLLSITYPINIDSMGTIKIIALLGSAGSWLAVTAFLVFAIKFKSNFNHGI